MGNVVLASLSLFVINCSDNPFPPLDAGTAANDGHALTDTIDSVVNDTLVGGLDAHLPDQAPVNLPPGQALVRAINDYRESKGLSRIAYSPSLSAVAQAHVDDLDANHGSTVNDTCNMHSWSDQGSWSSCCYTSDHAKAQCMWDKPQELTSYSGNGYEIAYWASWTPSAEDALEGWISSPGHHSVLASVPPWDDPPWKAMGAAIGKNYAAAWFGNAADPAR